MKRATKITQAFLGGGVVLLFVVTLVSQAVAQTCTPPPAGLVSWWPGDGNADDIQNGNDGTFVGEPSPGTYATGMVGQAFSFDGIDDYVFIPASASLNVGAGNGLTIDTWISPTDLSTARPIFEWSANSNSPGSIGAHFYVSASQQGNGMRNLFANLIDTGGNFHIIYSAPGVVTVNTFQHVAVTYDKTTGNASLYLNGAALPLNGTSNTAINLGMFTPRTSADVYLGTRVSNEFNDAGFHFMGLMDEVELFNRALSDAEIQAIVTAGSAGKCREPLIEVRTLTLAPVSDENPIGSSHTVTATVMDALAGAVQGIDVYFSVVGANAASGSCRTDATGQCPFSYTGTNAGSDVIMAFGDSDGDGVQDLTEPFGDATKIWNAPVSELGFVTGGGQVPSGSGRATFGFNAHSIPTTKGECTVIDHSTNPRTELKCTSVTAATVVDLPTGGGQATITGSGTINGVVMTYRIITTDVAEPGAGSDSFTIQTTSGPSYTAGGTLLNGNVQIHR